MQNIEQKTMAANGGKVITGPSGTITGRFYAIQVFVALSVSSIEIDGVENASLITTIPVGSWVFGSGITSIQISSGIAMLVS